MKIIFSYTTLQNSAIITQIFLKYFQLRFYLNLFNYGRLKFSCTLSDFNAVFICYYVIKKIIIIWIIFELI